MKILKSLMIVIALCTSTVAGHALTRDTATVLGFAGNGVQYCDLTKPNLATRQIITQAFERFPSSYMIGAGRFNYSLRQVHCLKVQRIIDSLDATGKLPPLQ